MFLFIDKSTCFTRNSISDLDISKNRNGVDLVHVGHLFLNAFEYFTVSMYGVTNI